MPSLSFLALGALAVSVVGVGAAIGGVVVLNSSPLADESDPASTPLPTVTAAAGGSVATITGGPGSKGEAKDGPPGVAQFSEPSGVAVAPDGTLVVVDFANRVVVRIDQQAVATRIAGTGDSGTQDGPALEATFAGPTDVAVGADGTIYITDGPGHRIRVLSPDGDVSTLAGSGEPGLSTGSFADGKGASARFDNPAGIAIDRDGALLVADYNNNRIRRVSLDGTVTTLAGNGDYGAKDGPALASSFAYPVALAVDGEDGTIYVLEHGNNGVRKISADRVVSTLVGWNTPFQPGSLLNYASAIAVGDDGVVYVADTAAHRIVVVGADGSVTGLAGQRGEAGWLDGAGTQALLSGPQGMAWSPSDGLIIADTQNSAIRKAATR